jgi:uncharacterized protein DUF4143
VQPPIPISDADWEALVEHGGFPEPFLRGDQRFTRRWRTLRQDQLTKQDLREVSRLQDLAAMETLALILAENCAQQLVYSNLSREIGTAVDTVRRWIDLLVRLHYGFLGRRWFKNVAKSLRKEPKWYLRDWSGIDDVGAREGIRTLSGEKIQWYLASELRDRIRHSQVRVIVVDKLARKQYEVEPRAYGGRLLHQLPAVRAAYGDAYAELYLAEGLKLKAAAASRTRTALKAALNLAVREKHAPVLLALESRLVRPLPGGKRRRDLFLDRRQRGKLLSVTKGALRDLIEGTALTGARAGELVKATVSQFDARTKSMTFPTELCAKP